jgi:hypothetical protein
MEGIVYWMKKRIQFLEAELKHCLYDDTAIIEGRIEETRMLLSLVEAVHLAEKLHRKKYRPKQKSRLAVERDLAHARLHGEAPDPDIADWFRSEDFS